MLGSLVTPARISAPGLWWIIIFSCEEAALEVQIQVCESVCESV